MSLRIDESEFDEEQQHQPIDHRHLQQQMQEDQQEQQQQQQEAQQKDGDSLSLAISIDPQADAHQQAAISSSIDPMMQSPPVIQMPSERQFSPTLQMQDTLAATAAASQAKRKHAAEALQHMHDDAGRTGGTASGNGSGSGSEHQSKRRHESERKESSSSSGSQQQQQQQQQHPHPSDSQVGDSGSGSQHRRRGHRGHHRSGSGSDSQRRYPSTSGTSSGSYSSSTSDTSESEDEAQQSQRRLQGARDLQQGQPFVEGGVAAAAAAQQDGDAYMMHQHADTGGHLFSCSTSQIETIVQLLTMLVLDKNQPVQLTIGASGIKIVAEQEKSRQVCAKAYLKKEIFTDYATNVGRLQQELPPPAGGARQRVDGAFEYACVVNLPNLLSCLQLFGAGTNTQSFGPTPILNLTIQHVGDELEMILDSGDGLGHSSETHCSLASIEPTSSRAIGAGFQFGRAAEKLVSCVIRSQHLRQAFSELDIADIEFLEVRVDLRQITDQDGTQHEEAMLSMGVKNDHGLQVDVELLRDAQYEIFWDGKIDLPRGQPFRIQYKLASLRPCIKALAKATMSNFRINEKGLLSIQHVIDSPMKNGVSNWIEYFCIAQAIVENELGAEVEQIVDGGAPAVAAAVPVTQQQQQRSTSQQHAASSSQYQPHQQQQQHLSQHSAPHLSQRSQH